MLLPRRMEFTANGARQHLYKRLAVMRTIARAAFRKPFVKLLLADFSAAPAGANVNGFVRHIK